MKRNDIGVAMYVIQICSSYLQNSFQKHNIRNLLMNLEGSDDYVI